MLSNNGDLNGESIQDVMRLANAIYLQMHELPFLHVPNGKIEEGKIDASIRKGIILGLKEDNENIIAQMTANVKNFVWDIIVDTMLYSRSKGYPNESWKRSLDYSIEDEVVFESSTCSCGRPHPIIKSIDGRSGEPIILPNGQQINPNLPSYIFKPLGSLGVIRKYRFTHHSDDKLELNLVVTNKFSDKHLDLVEKETKTAFGHNIPLSIKIVDSLPRLANAKHRDYIRIN